MITTLRGNREIISMKKNTANLLFFLFIIYIAVLLRITVFRSNFSLNGLFQNGNVNLTLFIDYMRYIRGRKWFLFFYLFVGNIVWFIPFGMYLQYTKKFKNILTVTLCGMLFSLCIETMQYVFGTGVTELDDLILNTFGAFLGAVCVKLFQKFRYR